MELTEHELNLVRQWYNAVRDTNPGYLTKEDVDLWVKITRTVHSKEKLVP